jgi:soluble lytic murein transglycosylase-like protein
MRMRLVNKRKFVICITVVLIIVGIIINNINTKEAKTQIIEQVESSVVYVSEMTIQEEMFKIKNMKVINTEESEPDIYYNISLSKELQKFTYDICQKYYIDFELALSVMWFESNFDINCVSYNKNSRGKVISKDFGIFQINSLYKGWYAKLARLSVYDVINPYDNIQMGIAGLAFYKNHWNKTYDTTELKIRFINSFNMGIDGFKKYVRNTGKISRAYDRKILNYKKNLMSNKIINIDKEIN